MVESITTERVGPPPIPNYDPGPPPDRSKERIERVAKATVVVSESESENDDQISLPDPFIAYSDDAANEARERNLQQIRKANADDKGLLGKYLPSNVNLFFPC